MNGNGKSFAILAEIVIGTIRVHALEPTAVNGPIASITRRVVHSILCCYMTMDKIFVLRYLDERMVGMLNIGNSKA
jgi:hypothetical protein